jgi:hypothetical protein
MTELIANEEQLLRNDIRNDAEKIKELIDDNCLEILSSGNQRVFKSGETRGTSDGELYIIGDTATLIDLADDCKILVYSAGKVNNNKRLKSIRSSVWKKTDSKWKMVFHQGTDVLE